MTDESAFLEFKADPSPPRLARLLTSVQDRVYNICFQILRRPEDAEDAAQEVLMEVTRGLDRIDAPRAFKVWLYKAAVHTALDRKEARDRRARLAPQPKDPSMNDAERGELMRAIGTLDDRTRCLVLEHYFDKATLEEIGAREGISAPAVFKRLERARETLRRALLGAGFAVAGAGVAQALESITPVVAPAGKALFAGGIVMGTKSAVSGGLIVAALLLVGAASTGGYLVGSRRAESRIRELTAQVERPAPAPPLERAPAPPVETPAIVTAPPPPPPVPPSAPATKGEASKPIGVQDPSRVFFGRPKKPNTEEALKVDSWEEFYLRAKELKLRGSDFEDAIFKRLGRELGLDLKALDHLRALFDREREETTRVIADSMGGPATFRQKLDDARWNWNAIQPEWARVRDGVRRTFNDEYLAHLTPDQLALFSEHMRNGEIGLEGAHDNDGSHYLVVGVGKLPK